MKMNAHQGSSNYSGNTRRYYFSENKFLKLYYFRGHLINDQKRDIQNEINVYKSNFIQSLSGLIPECLYFGINDESGYIVLNKIEGILLSELQINNKFCLETFNLNLLLNAIVKLESQQVYINDLRTWNIMILPDKTFCLIDLASFQFSIIDTDWTGNVFISFLLFIYELSHGSLLREDYLRQFRISPVWLNESTGKWMQKLWSIPYNQWSFKLIQELYSVDYSESEGFVINPLNIYLWMGVVEEFTYRSTGYANLSESIQANKLEINRLHGECANRDNAIHVLNGNLAQVTHELAQVNHNIADVNNQLRNEKNEVNRLHQKCAIRDNEVNRLHQKCAIRDNEVNKLHQECAIRDNEINRLHNECSVRDTEITRLHCEIHLRNAEIDRLNAYVGSIYATLSWKITKPLRLLKKGVRKIIYMPRQLVSRVKRVVKRVIIKFAKKIATINIIKRVGKSYLNKHPELKMKIKQKMIEKGLLHNPPLSLAAVVPKIDMATNDVVEQVRQQYGHDIANIYQILTKKK
jgi:O-antigen chain-terminating methyltransferase